MHLLPTGDVMVCCVSSRPLGHISEAPLLEIWDRQTRRDITDRLAVGDFSAGCEHCESEIALEGWQNSSMPNHIGEAHTGTVELGWSDRRWPGRIELNLSNACNLQCVQCNGELSSAIRRTEGRAPLPHAYDASLIDQLREFVPHLTTMGFAGGEPFMEPLNYAVWDLLAEANPSTVSTVNTNGTIYTPKVDRVLRESRIYPLVSFDAAERTRFESIRVGASFDRVVANIDKILEAVTARGDSVGGRELMGMVFCLMPENHDQLMPVLRFAEQRGIRVRVSVVRWPLERSIQVLAPAEIAAIDATLDEQERQSGRQIPLNRDVWDAERVRIRSWIDAGATAVQLS